MKKVLFATTALVASAGIASAQGVEVSGSAEMGVFGGETGGVTTELQFHTDIDVTFTMSGETDNGLTFGASIDIDESIGDADSQGAAMESQATRNDAAQGGETIFISGPFGTLTMGDTDGAFDWAISQTSVGGGSINDAETGHPGYFGDAGLDGNYDGQIARYDYSFSGFSVGGSVEIDDTGAGDPIFGIGAKYSGSLGGIDLSVGVGYQTGGPGANDEAIGASAQATFSSITIAGVFASVEEAGVTTESIGVGASYTFDAFTVGANYGTQDIGGATADGFGGFVNYDLGGGAVVQAGFGTGNTAAGVDTTAYSLGIAMSF